MLTDEEFLAFLNDKELDGSLEENLSKIIDDEMEKPEEEMDTELIEYCLDKLSELNSNATDANIKEGNGDSNDKHIYEKKNFIRNTYCRTLAQFKCSSTSCTAY